MKINNKYAKTDNLLETPSLYILKQHVFYGLNINIPVKMESATNSQFPLYNKIPVQNTDCQERI